MHHTTKKFLSTGRNFRYKRRKGNFLLIEQKKEVFTNLSNWFRLHMKEDIIVVSSFEDAFGYLENNAPNVKCVISSVPVRHKETAGIFLQNINKKFPGVVSVVYTEDNRIAQNIQENCPRVTVVCIGHDMHKLLDVISYNAKVVL